MRLPVELQRAIDGLADAAGAGERQRAAQQISQRYRSAAFRAPALRTPAERIAYLQTRMPATYAANRAAFAAVREVAPATAPRSLLDLGAGPGTAAWAAVGAFPFLERVHLVERDAGLVEAGRQLAAAHPLLAEAEWITADLADYLPETHDLVVISYALGELAGALAQQVIARAWNATRDLLVIVDAGTMKSFHAVHAARSQLLAAGAHPLAPCPHSAECPMFAGGDWCHFSARLERSATHRRMKSAALGFEDEKFSYFAATRQPAALPAARILRHPLIKPGHIQLTLCRPHTADRLTVTKSQKNLWRQARRARWGDPWNDLPGS